MAYGKDIFRTKYREANEGLKIVQNNYLELDHEYQMLAKRVEKAIEIYENKNACEYKKKRFMKDKSTSDLMYEVLIGGDEE